MIADRVWRTHEQAELAIVEWVAWFNHRRLHSSLGDIPPAEHEQQHAAALAADPEPALQANTPITLNVPGVYDPFGVVSGVRC
ncbi:MAG: integrase core domain-containing protein [Solirubrobacteraceae bacterium]